MKNLSLPETLFQFTGGGGDVVVENLQKKSPRCRVDLELARALFHALAGRCFSVSLSLAWPN